MSIPRKPTFCPHCHSHLIIRKGTRRNQYRIIPMYLCKSCFKYFTTESISRVKYPPHVIVRALCLYNLGYSQTEVATLLAKTHRIKIPRRTIATWLKRYKKVCTFNRLRDAAMQRYSPHNMILAQTFEHRQSYTFKVHRAKLDVLQQALEHPDDFKKLRSYLEDVLRDGFPHYLFADNNQSEEDRSKHRSSQVAMQLLPFVQTHKENMANDLALLGLVLAKRNKERHENIQEFMLINDSSTVAVEVPIYLTAKHIRYFHAIGFRLPLTEQDAPITGHIDFVQVRNGAIHILDYKPDARKINPVSQLTIYALALASHTKLPLKLFKCAWFDEKDYFEFYPLHSVYPRYTR